MSEVTDHIFYSQKLKINVYHSTTKIKSTSELQQQDIIITSKDVVGRAKNNDPILNISYSRIIFDEAHLLTKPTSQLFKKLSGLKRKYTWLLSGTPCLEIGNLFPLFNFLGYYDLKRQFTKDITSKYQIPGEIEGVRKIIRRVLLRRKKDSQVGGENIVKEVEKRYEFIHCKLNKEEREVYNMVYKIKKKIFKSFKKKNKKVPLKEIKKIYGTLKNFALHWKLAKTDKYQYLPSDDNYANENEDKKFKKLMKLLKKSRKRHSGKTEAIIKSM